VLDNTLGSPLTISRCQPYIGAEIGGVDLTKPISADVAAAIRAALLKYEVIVFRDQPITYQQHIDFGRVFVRNPARPFTYREHQATSIEGYPEIFCVYADGKKKAAVDIWHTDDCFERIPADVSILRSRVVPSLGGDTIFSSCTAAYDGLPGEVKERIKYLRAWHQGGYATKKKLGHSGDGLFDPNKSKDRQSKPPVDQPVVRIHPETRRPVLFVNEGLSGEILDMDPEEDAKLRHYLYDQIKKPDYQMRMHWTPDAVVVWDNRSTQHYAPGDYNEPRKMERVTVSGLEPCIGFADI